MNSNETLLLDALRHVETIKKIGAASSLSQKTSPGLLSCQHPGCRSSHGPSPRQPGESYTGERWPEKDGFLKQFLNSSHCYPFAKQIWFAGNSPLSVMIFVLYIYIQILRVSGSAHFQHQRIEMRLSYHHIYFWNKFFIDGIDKIQ